MRSLSRITPRGFVRAGSELALLIVCVPVCAQGYFRQGQANAAMKRKHAALACYQKALELDPSDKALIKACDVATAAAKDAPADPMGEVSASAPVTKPAPALKPAASKPAAAKTSEVVKDGAKKKTELRGYKTRSDGAKTTFFNNELTAEDKALIGDITPQKVEAPVVANTGPGSGWNSAGNARAREDGSGLLHLTISRRHF
jgi:tetratricopeptide (TPR) repeat protein